MLATNARQGQTDLDAMIYGSRLRQNNLNDQAAILRLQGKQAVTGSIFNAGSALVGGLSKIYDPAKAVSFGGSVFSPRACAAIAGDFAGLHYAEMLASRLEFLDEKILPLLQG